MGVDALVSRFYARDGARGADPVVTMTDQTSMYALPSQLADGGAGGAAAGGPSVFSRAVRTAKAVAPGAAVTAVVVVGGGVALKSWRDRRLRAFQQQLSGLDSIFGDLGLDPPAGGAAAPVDTAQMAKDILERSKTRYKFRDDDKPMKSAEPADGAKVKLDLFQGGGTGAAPAAPVGGAPAAAGTPAFDMNEDDIPAPPPGTTTAIKLPGAATPGAVRKVTGGAAAAAAVAGGGGVPAPTNAVETAIAAAFSSTSADTAALASGLRSSISAAGVAVPSSRSAFNAYASALVSATIDAAAGDVGNDAKGATALMDRLAAASAAITRASVLSRELYGGGPAPSLATGDAKPVPTVPLDLTYVGAYKGAPAQQEELYRRYAVWCLSSEQRVSSDVQSLVDMQALLGVSDARAEAINTDIAKGMFDVAVNAAMADGDLDDENRKQLQVLKDSFGELLDGDATAAGAGGAGTPGVPTDSATALKTMGALQELLKNQQVTSEDVAELRRLCKQMGVDIDDMLASADAMGSQLPAEAKQFVESLRGLLKESP